MPDRFRLACGIHQTPASAGKEVLKRPDQRTTAAGAQPSPFGKCRLDHLAGHRTGKIEIAVHILPAQADRIDVIEQTEIVLANILEIPGGIAIARNPRLPEG